METRTYTERSNARRAARAAGIDPDLVIETDDGFALPVPSDGGDDDDAAPAGNGTDPDQSAEEMKAEHAAAEDGVHDPVDSTPKTEDDDGIPAYLKATPEIRKAAWLRNPPKAARTPPKDTAMAKAKPSKRAKAEKPDKTAMLLKMLAGKGATVEKLTAALDWLPHTLRARISRLSKAKSKGGEGLKVERTRVDGVTTYRIAP